MYYNDYDSLNEKLYQKGNADTITNDPVEIARQYAEAGVDISHYSPSDLVRAHENYTNYSYEQDRIKDEMYRDQQERFLEEARAESERQKAIQEAELDALNAKIEENYQEMIENGEYVGNYSEEEKEFLQLYATRRHELYIYLNTKGLYQDEILEDGTIRSQECIFPSVEVCSYNEYTKEFEYGMVCNVAPILNRDFKIFVWREWYEYIGFIENYESKISEYEKLKSYKKPEFVCPEVETLATSAFASLKKRVESFKKTGVLDEACGKQLNYKIVRTLAFYSNPEDIVARIAKTMKEILG